MPLSYLVQQGDHLSAIAARHGFRDFLTIWDHPGNAALRAERDDPHVLAPGDVIQIPERVQRNETRGTGQSHRFTVADSPLLMRLRLVDWLGVSLSSADVSLSIDNSTQDLVTDANGLISRDIGKTTRRGVLTARGVSYRLEIGDLDPVSTRAGLLGRLRNLGYEIDPEEDDEEEVRFVVGCFQRDRKLPVTFEAADVRDAVLAAHGV